LSELEKEVRELEYTHQREHEFGAEPICRTLTAAAR